jgi:phage terminase large subunit GpA-like protein
MSYQQSIDILWSSTTRLWSPPPKITLSEWADAHAWLSPESSAQSGKWTTMPYQRGIMDAMTDPAIEKVTVMKSARTGYTKAINCYIAYSIHCNPRNTLVVQPTIEDAQGYSKDEILPMLRDTPIIAPLVPDLKTRDSNNTILRKHFPGMTLTIIGANSPRGFRRISAGSVIFDEVDGYPLSAGEEGDQIALGTRRGDFFWDRKVILGSTPTIKGISRIEDSYEASDRRLYLVPCPHCEMEQPLEWSNIDFSTHGTIKKPVYICAGCGEAIPYSKHRWMIERGRWHSRNPEVKGHAGFFVWSAYSYSPNATWAHIVKEFLESKDNPLRLKTFVNTWLGQTWEEQGEKLDSSELLKSREDYGHIVPDEAAILTASVDTQKDRLEVLIKAWAKDEESYNMEHIVINGNPSLPAVWERLDAILTAPYQHMNGTNLNIHSAVIDTGGHHTDHVYAFVKPRIVRNVYAIKGANKPGSPIISRPSRKNKAKIDLYMVGVSTAKDLVSSRLQMKDSGPGKIHFPVRFSHEYFEQLTAEKKVVRYSKGRTTYEWIQVKTRNEAFDLEVYAVAALRLICPDVSILNSYVDQLHGKAPKSYAKQKRRIINRGIE